MPFHLQIGFRETVRRSTQADANKTCDWHIYAESARRLIVQARTLNADASLGLESTNTVYALDSATIDVCRSGWAWHPGDGRRPGTARRNNSARSFWPGSILEPNARERPS
jgi:hypothetical protein